MRLIDADALIERWRGMKCGCEREECGREIEPCIVVMTVEEAPTIEPKRGEWIEYRPPTESYCGMVECPFCGEELVGEPTDFNYCPNCGSQMKGADDEVLRQL